MKKITGFKVFVALIVVCVLAVIVYACIIAGSPKEQRERQFDDQRINALSQISSSVNSFYLTNKILPSSLDFLSTQPYFFGGPLTDPKTGEKFEYAQKVGAAYELCATFAFATDDKIVSMYARPVAYQQMWKHDAGHYCFELNAQTGSLFDKPTQAVASPPAPTPVVSTCKLMQDKKTGKIDCYGCANGICKTAPDNSIPYVVVPEKGHVSIPYSCTPSDQGCVFAQ